MTATTSSDPTPPVQAMRRAPARKRSIRAVATGAMIVLTLVLTACSSSNSPTVTSNSADTQPSSSAPESGASTYPAGKEDVCQARDQLSASINALTDSALLTGGAAGIQAAVGEVQTSLTALVAAGKDDYGPQLDALQTALDQVQTAVGEVGNGNAATGLVGIGTAIGSVGSAASNLFTALRTTCGS
ncbi:hypothetical protein ACVBEQ_20835 [Nakamurella sp. GG22]